MLMGLGGLYSSLPCLSSGREIGSPSASAAGASDSDWHGGARSAPTGSLSLSLTWSCVAAPFPFPSLISRTGQRQKRVLRRCARESE
jgi:hypothetical protein